MEYDVVALGELLIDFTDGGQSEQGNPLFEANPGGAPCNVLAMLARRGKKTAFIGKVGNDIFGRQLRNAIEAVGIGAGGLQMDSAADTTLAFVQNAPDGDREFSFFRRPGADTMLRSDEIDGELLCNTRIFHFGSLSLTNEPARSATRQAVQLARRGGALVSFDPNLRPPLWDDVEHARRQIAWGCGVCDILKIAEEELEFLFGQKDVESGAAELRRQYPQLQIIFVTRGKDGAECFYKECHVARPTYLSVKTVDTTGAGDTFCGSCLAHLLDTGLARLDEEQITRMLDYANAAASLVTTKKGALRAMPADSDVLKLMGV